MGCVDNPFMVIHSHCCIRGIGLELMGYWYGDYNWQELHPVRRGMYYMMCAVYDTIERVQLN